MTRLYLIIFLLLVCSNQLCYPQKSNKDERLHEIVSIKVSIFSVRDRKVYISLSPLTVEWFIGQKFEYEIVDNSGNKGIKSALNMEEALGWDSYPTYSQYDSIMQSFSNNYPDLCRLDTIGTSVNGKLVLALKISDNPGTDEDEPEVFYSSTIHGDETGGFILMLRLADYLLKNYSLNDRARNLIDNLEVWINPLANPDGTYGTGNIISYPTRYNANGKDLNRNFPDPFLPGEIQQKENIDMIQFMRKHKFVLSANFHAGAEVVNYPWDSYLSKYHADNAWFDNISRAYADTVHVYSGPAYMNFMDNGVTRGAVWYPINGGRQDFVTRELQGREVTIELDDIKLTPAAQLELLWLYNWRSLLGYIENALYGIHGLVTNSVTFGPVAARVFIPGHDKDSSHVYSDPVAGSFVRFLEPGMWDLIFSADGYVSDTVKNISVAQGKKTDLAIELIPAVNSIHTTNPDNLLLYPNPATSEINAVLPQGIVGSVSVTLIDQSGRVISEYDTEAISGIPVRISVGMLPGGVYSVLFRHSNKQISYQSRFIVIK